MTTKIDINKARNATNKKKAPKANHPAPHPVTPPSNQAVKIIDEVLNVSNEVPTEYRPPVVDGVQSKLKEGRADLEAIALEAKEAYAKYLEAEESKAVGEAAVEACEQWKKKLGYTLFLSWQEANTPWLVRQTEFLAVVNEAVPPTGTGKSGKACFTGTEKQFRTRLKKYAGLKVQEGSGGVKPKYVKALLSADVTGTCKALITELAKVAGISEEDSALHFKVSAEEIISECSLDSLAGAAGLK